MSIAAEDGLRLVQRPQKPNVCVRVYNSFDGFGTPTVGLRM
jgi:hypothetical protein